MSLSKSDDTKKEESPKESPKEESKELIVLPTEEVPKLSKREELQHKLNAILEECGWQESNIPIVSEYWSLRNQLLSMK